MPPYVSSVSFSLSAMRPLATNASPSRYFDMALSAQGVVTPIDAIVTAMTGVTIWSQGLGGFC